METNHKDNTLVPLSLEAFNTGVNANLSTDEENPNILINCAPVMEEFSLPKSKEDLPLRGRNKRYAEDGFPLIKRMKLTIAHYSMVTGFNQLSISLTSPDVNPSSTYFVEEPQSPPEALPSPIS